MTRNAIYRLHTRRVLMACVPAKEDTMRRLRRAPAAKQPPLMVKLARRPLLLELSTPSSNFCGQLFSRLQLFSFRSTRLVFSLPQSRTENANIVATETKPSPAKQPVNTHMLPIMLVMGVMFIGMCVALNLFSR